MFDRYGLHVGACSSMRNARPKSAGTFSRANPSDSSFIVSQTSPCPARHQHRLDASRSEGMWLIRSVYHKPMAIANQFSERRGGQGTAIDKIGGDRVEC